MKRTYRLYCGVVLRGTFPSKPKAYAAFVASADTVGEVFRVMPDGTEKRKETYVRAMRGTDPKLCR